MIPLAGITAPSEQYRLGGRCVSARTPDLREILHHAGHRYAVKIVKGLSVILEPSGDGGFMRPTWYVTFNEADLYHPDDWFHEASSNMGHLLNQQMHGPYTALNRFCVLLHGGKLVV